MATEIVSRPVSAESWARALERAIAAGVDVLTEPLSGATFCESTRHPGVLYRVDRESCSCVAGSHGQPCLHRAALLAQLGELALPSPAVCLWCAGSGRQEDPTNQQYIPCPDCNGSGVRPDRRLTGQPAVMPTAVAA